MKDRFLWRSILGKHSFIPANRKSSPCNSMSIYNFLFLVLIAAVLDLVIISLHCFRHGRCIACKGKSAIAFYYR